MVSLRRLPASVVKPCAAVINVAGGAGSIEWQTARRRNPATSVSTSMASTVTWRFQVLTLMALPTLARCRYQPGCGRIQSTSIILKGRATSIGLAKAKALARPVSRSGPCACTTATEPRRIPRGRTVSASICSIPREGWVWAATYRRRCSPPSGFISWALPTARARISIATAATNAVTPTRGRRREVARYTNSQARTRTCSWSFSHAMALLRCGWAPGTLPATSWARYRAYVSGTGRCSRPRSPASMPPIRLREIASSPSSC